MVEVGTIQLVFVVLSANLYHHDGDDTFLVSQVVVSCQVLTRCHEEPSSLNIRHAEESTVVVVVVLAVVVEVGAVGADGGTDDAETD